MSITVISCSSWSASTIARPTWAAPSTMIFMRANRRSPMMRSMLGGRHPRGAQPRRLRCSSTSARRSSLPAAIAVGYGEAVWPFLVAGAVTFACGAGVEALTDGKERIGPREGYLVVSLVWLLIAVFGALPYVLAEPQLSQPARRAVRVDVGLLDDRGDRRSPASATCRARWRCGGRSPPGSAASGSSSCSSPCCRACASAAARRSSRPSRRGRSSGWRRRSASRRGASSCSTSAITAAEVAILTRRSA